MLYEVITPEAADAIRSDPERNYGYEYLAIIDPLYKRLAKPAGSAIEHRPAAVEAYLPISSLSYNFV